MAWVPDSTTAGFLGPETTPQPLADDDWADFLHDLVSGVSGLDPTLCRPRWQPEPPVLPPLNTNWVAFGVTSIETDFEAYVGHFPEADGGLGLDALQEHEIDTVLCSFYGPNAERYFSFLRRGLFIEQNRAMLRANAVGLVEISEPTVAPELIKQQWVNRIDVNVVLRREIRFNYAVRNLLQSKGLIYGNDPLTDRVVTMPWDTGLSGDAENPPIEQPGEMTLWDAPTHRAGEPNTIWDDNQTVWDL